MTKRQFSILLGLACQTGCVIYDETLRREPSDAAMDGPRDGVRPAMDATVEPLVRADVTFADVEASGEASADAGAAEDGLPGDTRDEGESDAAYDATIDPFPDHRPPDGSVDVDAESVGADSGGGPDAASDAFFDAQRDAPDVGCDVDFTVSGVTWDDDGPTADGGSRGVRLVGDIGLLGAWEPTSGLLLLEKAPGAWSTSIHLADRLAIEFKFVKTESDRSPEWEEWLPFNSNRSLMVDCTADGGTVWVDAATEAGPAHRAVGRSYGGAFGIRPLDATK